MTLRSDRTYIGIDDDGLSPTATIVRDAWVFGLLPRERHQRIYDEAIRRARQQGWNPELDDET
jgi:hypothetical protein